MPIQAAVRPNPKVITAGAQIRRKVMAIGHYLSVPFFKSVRHPVTIVTGSHNLPNTAHGGTNFRHPKSASAFVTQFSANSSKGLFIEGLCFEKDLKDASSLRTIVPVALQLFYTLPLLHDA